MSLTDDQLISLLERDYRRLLRWYPRSWRDAHGEVLLGILMDDADAADRFTLRRGEWRSFATEGLTARLDRLVLPQVRDAAATVMLPLGFVLSITWTVLTSWGLWSSGLRVWGLLTDFVPILAVLWTVAMVAAWADRWWVGRVALLASTVVAFGQMVTPTYWQTSAVLVAFAVTSAAVASLGTPRRGLPLAGATVGAVAADLGGYYWSLPTSDGVRVVEWPLEPSITTAWFTGSEVPSVMILIATGVAVILCFARWWTAAFTLLLLAVPATVTLDVVLLTGGYYGAPRTLNPWLVTAPVALGILLLVLASRGSVHLPRRRRAEDATPTA